MDILKIDPLVLNHLRKAGFDDSDIASMSAEQAFVAYCRYHGMLRGSALIKVIDNLRGAGAPA